MKNLDEWRENVVEFLSTRKKYRVFGKEFGPRLLDDRIKEGKNYTKDN
ncbi:hypothetical protein [Wolbachia endosymbiont of Pentidionis agamae]